jgi:hypothetical protein
VPSSRVRRSLVGVLGSVLLASALSACAFLPQPPEGATADFDAIVAGIRDVDGVAGVEASLSQSEDQHPQFRWDGEVTVTLSSSAVASPGQLVEVAAEIRDASAAGVTGSGLDVELRVPAVGTATSTHVDALDPSSVEVADVLRFEPAVAGATVDAPQVFIRLAPGVTLQAAVTAVRPLVGQLYAVLAQDATSVELAPTPPGPALLARLDALRASARVDTISYVAIQSPPGPAVLKVTAADVDAVAAELAATPDEGADAGTSDRTAFSVAVAGDPGGLGGPFAVGAPGVVRGWLGLPLGSPDPPRI